MNPAEADTVVCSIEREKMASCYICTAKFHFMFPCNSVHCRFDDNVEGWSAHSHELSLTGCGIISRLVDKSPIQDEFLYSHSITDMMLRP